MLSDPVTTAGLVAREVRTGHRDGRPTRIAVARRTYGTSQADLWDALTNPDRIPRWFLPVSGDLREGGRYQLEGNAGGTVERCAEPDGFAVTWEFGGTVSWLQITLSRAAGGTTLELVHESPVDPEMWQQFGPGALGVGWDLALVGLGLHVETDGAPTLDPDEMQAWTVSPDGVVFVEHAADAWAEAAIADGDDAAAAREAASRTVGFYTTVPGGEPEA